jgi:ATPase family associated with various cellular activities (AAA)
MRPVAIVETLITMIKAQQPVMIHGSPGVGKSQVVRQVADSLGFQLIDLRLSQLDPVDLRGVPSINTKTRKTNWNTPDFLPDKGEGIIFYDEMNAAPQATQAAAYQLILDRKLGDYKLPPGWAQVAAGNRATDRAIVNTMSTALKNRFAHLDFEVNNEDWCSWALNADIATQVISFLRFRPMLLNEFEARDKGKEEATRVAQLKNSNAFATPRSWEAVSKVLEQKPNPNTEFEIYSGIVGEGAAIEFMGFLKYEREVPNLDALLLNPKGTPVPTNPATLYALATGLAAKATKGSFDGIMLYADRMPKEFQVLMIKDITKRTPALAQTRTFTKWATENSDILF